jgi:nucleobase:cation symporter-1, NCS1 family
VRTQRAAMWGSMIGYVPVCVLAQAVGLAAALVMGSPDPTEWMLPIAGPLLSIVLLAFICFANLTSMSGVVYAIIQSFVQHLGPRVQAIGWSRIAGLYLALCAAFVFFTETLLYDRFFVFLAWVQAVLVGLIGITLADYLLLRGRQISLFALYDLSAGSPYWYWRGINFSALAALFVSFVVYVLILNPVSLKSAAIFSYVSASIPALLVAVVTHVALTRWLVIPASKGGYPRMAAAMRGAVALS